MEKEVFGAIGEEGFTKLVSAFYRRVPGDDLLGPMYPDDDLEGAEKRLRDFLLFRFGGDPAYIQERGHPRLRLRHVHFSIGKAERDRWLSLMSASMDECDIHGEARELLDAFFLQVADFMRNKPD